MRMRIFSACCLLFLAVTAATHGLSAAAPPQVLDLGSGVSLPLVLIPQGNYMQGSPLAEPERGTDEAQRFVHLSSAFHLGKTAVTRAQWERFVTATNYRSEAESGPSGGFGWDGSAMIQKKEFTWRNPGFAQTPDHPVTIVTYRDADAFCKWLTKKSGYNVQLPTEAQWEYACRAGITTAWFTQSTEAVSDDFFWHKRNSGNATHPVTSKPANPWGLYIGGNVAEWCQDWYAPYESGPLTDPVQQNPNLSDKPRRVLRGGSWARDPKNTRSAARFRADPQSRNADIGFRVVVLPGSAAPVPMQDSGGLLPRMESKNSTSQTPPSVGRTEPRPNTAPPATPPPSPSASAPETAEVAASDTVNFTIGLSCLLCPLLVIVVLVYLVVRSKKKKLGAPPPLGPKAVGTSMAAGAAMAAALQRPTGKKGKTKVRIADDGFWLLLDAPRGALVQYVYRPAGGMDSNGQAKYEPGPEGHFVFTGARPENVRIISAGGSSLDENDAYDDSSSDSDDSASFTANDAPPRYPSAY